MVLCNTIVQEAKASCLNPLLHKMTTHTPVANENLSSWYFTARYAALVFEQRISKLEELNIDAAYDRYNLEKLREMEQFFKMSWDTWMDDLESTCNHKETVK